MENFGLPEPVNFTSKAERQILIFNKAQCEREYLEAYAKLNDAQRRLVDEVRQKIEQHESGLLFLNGPAGKR